MAFYLRRFYEELDQHYSEHDNTATEAFLQNSLKKAYEEGLDITPNEGCPSCVPELKPNWEYVAVCNETACFYRGLGRFKESLACFNDAEKELDSFYKQNTPEYATLQLNKAGTYRYMGRLEDALEHFEKARKVLESDAPAPPVLAGLYNNIGLVWLDKKDPVQALTCFQKALSLIEDSPDMIVEQGSTWNNMAAAYRSMKQNREAVQAADMAVSILSKLDCGVNPHYPAALNTRGMLHYDTGRYEEALADFLAALEKTKLVYGENMEYQSGCANTAEVLRKLGREKEAAAWEEKSRTLRS